MDRTIICMKWGTRYGPEFVNRLYAASRRNITGDFRFICFTDDGTGLVEAVEVHPLPPITLPEEFAWTPWRKLSIWQYPLAGMKGDVIFLDLDLVITGSLDEMFSYQPGEYCVIENWTQKGMGVGNTSAFKFPVEKYKSIYDQFEQDPEKVLAENRIEQQYISRYIESQKFWPSAWCLSFKHNLVPPFPLNWMKAPSLPPEARLVAFTGKPDPDEALAGAWPAPWYKKWYKHVQPTKWVGEHWR